MCRLFYNLEQSGIFENHGVDYLVDIMQRAVSFHSRMVKQEPLKRELLSRECILLTLICLLTLLFVLFLVLAKNNMTIVVVYFVT